MKPRIFDQEQIARAVELCLGAFSAAGINMIAADKNSQDYKKRIEEILKKE
jgi:hypothetical protein